jgi:uncharacterized protein (DUF2267 family)
VSLLAVALQPHGSATPRVGDPSSQQHFAETTRRPNRQDREETIMTNEEFLKRIQDAGAHSPEEAGRAAAAVVVALSHLLPDAESRRHFASQMPGPLKARLLAEAPRALLMNRDAFVKHVGAALDVHAADAERLLHAVYRALKEAVSAGQIAEFESRVPKDVAVLLAHD